MTRISNETKRLGQTLKRIRKQNGYSQKVLSEVLGVTFQQVQKYENGKNRLPAEKLHILKLFYAIPYSAFFEDFENLSASPDTIHKAQAMPEMICKNIQTDA
jgi:transcriptional regulator with XRE-family HTH domain